MSHTMQTDNKYFPISTIAREEVAPLVEKLLIDIKDNSVNVIEIVKQTGTIHDILMRAIEIDLVKQYEINEPIKSNE